MATGYTVTGGSASVAIATNTSDFTLTPTGRTFSGTDTITIASVGGQITATAPNGSNWVEDGQTIGSGSASLLITPLEGDGAFTFRVKWPTPGAKTITYANGQVWANASNSSVTVLASGSYKKIGQSGVILLGGGISIVGK